MDAYNGAMSEPTRHEGERPRQAAKPQRRQYAKPRLSEYGSVAKLTQGTATKQSDGGGGGFRRQA